MKKLLILLSFVFFISSAYAYYIPDKVPVQIQVEDYGSILTGTFNFIINISNTSDCNNVEFSYNTTLATDNRGIVSFNMENFSINPNNNFTLCYYRDGVMKVNKSIGSSIYAIYAQNVSWQGVIGTPANWINYIYNQTYSGSTYNASYVPYTGANQNVNLDGYNLTFTNGRVGIGTSTPLVGLHLNSAGNSIEQLRVGSNSDTTKFISMGDDFIKKSAFEGSSTVLTIETIYHSGRIKINTANQNFSTMFDSNGRVGIGSQVPTAKLDINGTGILLNIHNATNTFLYVNETTGRVGINKIPDSAVSLDVSGSIVNSQMAIEEGTNLGILRARNNNPLSLRTSNLDRIIIGSEGNVTIFNNLSANQIYANGILVNNWLYNQTESALIGNGTFVPYTGATANIDLGENNITANSYHVNKNGLMFDSIANYWAFKYDDAIGVLDTGMLFNIGAGSLEVRYLNTIMSGTRINGENDGTVFAYRANFTNTGSGYSADFGRTNGAGVFYSSNTATALSSTYLNNNVSGIFLGTNGNIALLGNPTTAISATGNISVTNGDVYINNVGVSQWLYNQSANYVPYNNSNQNLNMTGYNITTSGIKLIGNGTISREGVDTKMFIDETGNVNFIGS